jgi:hypothetical protein
MLSEDTADVHAWETFMASTRLEGPDPFAFTEITAGSAELREQLKRATYLRHLLEVYHSDDDNKPHDAPMWETWLRQSGELPPDFDALPTNAFLPDVLLFNDGSRVRTPEGWPQRREEILDILQHYQLGRWPPPPPKMLRRWAAF